MGILHVYNTAEIPEISHFTERESNKWLTLTLVHSNIHLAIISLVDYYCILSDC